MARTTTVSLIDDIDGQTPATETIRFALDGLSYEIELSDENARALRAAFHPWTAAGRRVGGDGSRRLKTSGRTVRGPVDPAQNGAIRAWARSTGHEVSHRGRIPDAIVDAFRAAH